jgi:uncharacterized membrane protein (DUF4010 family)
MIDLDLSFRILLAFVLGGVVGLEREINERKNIQARGQTQTKASAIIGLRTFSLVSGLGCFCGLLYQDFVFVSTALLLTFAGLLLVYYQIESTLTSDVGITTELALIFTFIIGFLLPINFVPVQLIIALTVVLVLVMSRKEAIKDFVEEVGKNEINAFVSFGILAFVILPFLPNESYSLSSFGGVEIFLKNIGLNIEELADLELINPFELWFIVVLITGIEIAGYLLERSLGKSRGWLLASMVGGFVSSTATTISIAQRSRAEKRTGRLLAGAIMATLISFIPMSFLLASLNIRLFIEFFSVLLIMGATALGLGFYFYRKGLQEGKMVGSNGLEQEGKVFDLPSALRFAGLFLIINIASKAALIFLGSSGLLLTTAIGALTGMDAVVINISDLAKNRIDISLGVWALLLANGVNLTAKSFYSFVKGSREFAVRYSVSMVIVITSSVLGVLVF